MFDEGKVANSKYSAGFSHSSRLIPRKGFWALIYEIDWDGEYLAVQLGLKRINIPARKEIILTILLAYSLLPLPPDMWVDNSFLKKIIPHIFHGGLARMRIELSSEQHHHQTGHFLKTQGSAKLYVLQKRRSTGFDSEMFGRTASSCTYAGSSRVHIL